MEGGGIRKRRRRTKRKGRTGSFRLTARNSIKREEGGEELKD